MSSAEARVEVTIERDLVFSQIDGFRPLTLDLYTPAEGARAVCLYLHGGGWRVGSRRADPGPVGPTSGRLFSRMAAQGLAVASASYRLSGEAHFPAQLDDALAAAHWLRNDCDAAAGLPLVVFGVSAGGLLAALVALRQGSGAQAAALWYTVTDLGAMPDTSDSSREALLLGGPVSSLPDLARAASPIANIHAEAPPFLLLHGDADSLVPFAQSDSFHSALSGSGVRSTLVSVPGADHMFRNMADADVEALVDRSVAFLLDAIA